MPHLAEPRQASPSLASPRLASPCLAKPSPARPCHAPPCPAAPNPALPCLALPLDFKPNHKDDAMPAQPRFRLTAPVIAETNLQCAVVDALDKLLLPPAQYTCFPAGSVPLPPEYAAKLARMGLHRGWPDLLVVHGGGVFGIELKTRDGILSRTRIVRTKRGGQRELIGQREQFELLTQAGMKIAICRSLDDVLAALAAWGVPLRSWR